MSQIINLNFANRYEILYKRYYYFCKGKPKKFLIPLIGGSRLWAIIVGGHLMKELYEHLLIYVTMGPFFFELVL